VLKILNKNHLMQVENYNLQLEKYKKKKSQLTHQLLFIQTQSKEINEKYNQLISHNNPKQKIQHHVKIKEEYNILKKEKSQLAELLSQRELHIRSLEQALNQKETNTKLSEQHSLNGSKKIITHTKRENENKENVENGIL